MKILLVTSSLQPTDGWGRYGNDLARLLADRGNEVAVFCEKKFGVPNVREIDGLDSPLKYMLNIFRCFSGGLKFARIVRELKPDVVHFIIEPYMNILPFAGKIDAKKILTVHGSYAYMPDLFSSVPARWLSKFLISLSLSKFDNIIAVSNFSRRYLVGKMRANGLPIKEEKIVFLPNWIDPKREIKLPDNKNDAGNKQKKILFVGGIKPRKGILEAIEAVKVYNEIPKQNFVFDIVGSYNENDSYYKRAVLLIDEYGLSDKIFFRGRVDEKALDDYYAGADLFMMLSVSDGARFEGFGLVYLEASSFGVPCIGSINCGAEDAIYDGRTGYLADPHDPGQVADKIRLILDELKIKRELCIAWAQEHNADNTMRLLTGLYKQI